MFFKGFLTYWIYYKSILISIKKLLKRAIRVTHTSFVINLNSSKSWVLNLTFGQQHTRCKLPLLITQYLNRRVSDGRPYVLVSRRMDAILLISLSLSSSNKTHNTHTPSQTALIHKLTHLNRLTHTHSFSLTLTSHQNSHTRCRTCLSPGLRREMACVRCASRSRISAWATSSRATTRSYRTRLAHRPSSHPSASGDPARTAARCVLLCVRPSPRAILVHWLSPAVST